MALDRKAAALALHRFGLGPRRDSIGAIASDPRGALLAELDAPNVGLVADAGLPSAAESSRAAFEFQLERRARDIAEQQAKERGDAVPMSADMRATAAPDARPAVGPNIPQQNYLRE